MESAPAQQELPTESETGMVGRWPVDDDNGTRWTITGRFIGSGSSRKPRHRDHLDGTFADVKLKCGACRWLELLIFQELAAAEDTAGPTGNYFVVKVGASEVPGESDRYTVTKALSADEVVVAVSTRRDGSMTMTRPAQIALARAAGRDDQIREAYRAAA